MAVYLAVDANGSSTECLIADEERILSRVAGEPVRLESGGLEDAKQRLHRSLKAAGTQAGVPLYLVQRACAGVEGLGEEGVRHWAKSALRELLPGELVLTGREDIAFEAAFGRAAGVLVLAANTSMVLGRSSNQSRFAAADWGPVLGGDGAKVWIGLEGLRSGLRGLDLGLSSTLLRELQAAWDAPQVGTLLARFKGILREAPENLAALAPVVARCAAGGDPLARSVLERAGEALSAQVSVVLSKMRAAACRPGDLQRVAFAGSTLTELPQVREALAASLQRTYPTAVVDEQATDPLLGALARARRL